jgi:hypothetical protein
MSGLPRGPTDLAPQRENTYNGKSNQKTYFITIENLLFFSIDQLASIPEFAHLGAIFKSSAPVDLTESEVEYVVRCIKHVFSHYIVFQVKIFFPVILFTYSFLDLV